MVPITLVDNRLECDGVAVLVGLPEGAQFAGSVLSLSATEAADQVVMNLGEVPGLARFTCAHRYEPFWMTPEAGTSLSQISIETQYILIERESGDYVLLVPMVKGTVRCSLQGTAAGFLEVVAETGDTNVLLKDFAALFVAVGPSPYDLIEESAAVFAKAVGSVRLRRDKDLPLFADWFGWCTWDAFYSEVSHEKVREGLQSFRDGGLMPKYMILDDGWLSVAKSEDGSNRLTAFEPNEKFPGGLAPTVDMAKDEYGLDQVLAWHAMTGFWGGVDPSLGDYGTTIETRKCSPGIYSYVKEMMWWGPTIGLVPKESIYRFFQDFHRYLRSQGIDGVKVDVQAQLELVAEGTGGRVSLMQCYHEALEGSVQVHFEGNLINCMSLANEMIYSTLASSLTRSFTDFWPDQPGSHGLHLYANAQNSVWFSEFIHPDWDMFQSGHAAGPYHAAARAISGGPVYVSDKPDGHNFELLQKLALPNGEALRALEPAKPTRDCLMHNATKEDVLLKIFSFNEVGAVIGAFNARFDTENPITISGSVSPSDVDGIEGKRFAVFAHTSRELRVMSLTDTWPLSLEQLGWEIFTIVPIEEGFAPIGLADMLNTGGSIAEATIDAALVRFGGKALFYRRNRPKAALADDEPVRFTHDKATGALWVDLPARADILVQFE